MRHGEYENPDKLMPGRSEGFPLSEKGIIETRAAGVFLKDKKIARVFSSPLLRTKQTAEIIAREIGVVGIQFDDRLLELNVGEYTNRPIEHFEKSGFYQDMVQSPATVENIDSVCSRISEFLTEKKELSENILVVTHVYSVRCFLCTIHGTALKDCFQYKPGTSQVFEIYDDINGTKIQSVFPVK